MFDVHHCSRIEDAPCKEHHDAEIFNALSQQLLAPRRYIKLYIESVESVGSFEFY